MDQSIFHVGRVFHVDAPSGDFGGWYFEVRGADPRGPFATRRLAELSLAECLLQMPDTPRGQDSRETEGEE